MEQLIHYRRRYLNMRHGKVLCILLCGVLTVSLVLAVGTASAQPVSIDAKTLKKLQETIDQQQLLMQKQTQELKSQSEMLNALQKQVNDLSHKASVATTQAAEAKVAAEQAKQQRRLKSSIRTRFGEWSPRLIRMSSWPSPAR